MELQGCKSPLVASLQSEILPGAIPFPSLQCTLWSSLCDCWSVSIKRMRAAIQKEEERGPQLSHSTDTGSSLRTFLKWQQQPPVEEEVTKRSLKTPIGHSDYRCTIPFSMSIPSRQSATNGEIWGGWISCLQGNLVSLGFEEVCSVCKPCPIITNRP